MKQMKLLKKYQKGLEKSVKESKFVFDGVDLSLSRDGPHIDSPKWLKNKKSTINRKNNDEKCNINNIIGILLEYNIN